MDSSKRPFFLLHTPETRDDDDAVLPATADNPSFPSPHGFIASIDHRTSSRTSLATSPAARACRGAPCGAKHDSPPTTKILRFKPRRLLVAAGLNSLVDYFRRGTYRAQARHRTLRSLNSIQVAHGSCSNDAAAFKSILNNNSLTFSHSHHYFQFAPTPTTTNSRIQSPSPSRIQRGQKLAQPR